MESMNINNSAKEFCYKGSREREKWVEIVVEIDVRTYLYRWCSW